MKDTDRLLAAKRGTVRNRKTVWKQYILPATTIVIQEIITRADTFYSQYKTKITRLEKEPCTP